MAAAEKSRMLAKTAHATWVLTDVIDSKQTMLSLNGLQLQDLPPLFYDEMLEGRLPPLEVISLKSNLLTYIPPEIAMIPTLRMLYLDENRIKVIPADFPPSLACLFLRGNKIEKIPPALCELHSLQLLDLRGNNLVSVPAAVARMRSLNVLKVSENPALRALPLEVIKKKSLKIEIEFPIIFPVREFKIGSDKTPTNVAGILEYIECAGFREWPLDLRCHWETEKPSCHLCHSAFGETLPPRNCRICGRRVCSPCSLGRYEVPCYAVSEPIRTCDTCAAELVTQTIYLRFNVLIHESESEADISRPASVRPLSKRPPMPDAPIVSTLQSLAKATAQKNKELTELQKQEEAPSALEKQKLRSTLLNASEVYAARNASLQLAAAALSATKSTDTQSSTGGSTRAPPLDSQPKAEAPSLSPPQSPSTRTVNAPQTSGGSTRAAPIAVLPIKKVPLLALSNPPAVPKEAANTSSTGSPGEAPSKATQLTDDLVSPRARAVISVVAGPRQQQQDSSVTPGRSGRVTELERKHKETCVDLRAALNSGLAMQRLIAAFGPGNAQAEGARKQLADEGQRVTNLKTILAVLEQTLKEQGLTRKDAVLDADVEQFLTSVNNPPKSSSPRKGAPTTPAPAAPQSTPPPAATTPSTPRGGNPNLNPSSTMPSTPRSALTSSSSNLATAAASLPAPPVSPSVTKELVLSGGGIPKVNSTPSAPVAAVAKEQVGSAVAGGGIAKANSASRADDKPATLSTREGLTRSGVIMGGRANSTGEKPATPEPAPVATPVPAPTPSKLPLSITLPPPPSISPRSGATTVSTAEPGSPRAAAPTVTSSLSQAASVSVPPPSPPAAVLPRPISPPPLSLNRAIAPLLPAPLSPSATLRKESAPLPQGTAIPAPLSPRASTQQSNSARLPPINSADPQPLAGSLRIPLQSLSALPPPPQLSPSSSSAASSVTLPPPGAIPPRAASPQLTNPTPQHVIPLSSLPPPPDNLTAPSPRKLSSSKAPLPAVIVPVPPVPSSPGQGSSQRARGGSKPTPVATTPAPVAPSSALPHTETTAAPDSKRGFLLGSQRSKPSTPQASPTVSPHTSIAPLSAAANDLSSVLSLIEEAEALLASQTHGPRPTISNTTARVITSYKTAIMGEMSVKAGDIVTVADDADPDWVFGFANSDCGHLQFMRPNAEMATKVETEAEAVSASLAAMPSVLQSRQPKEEDIQAIALAAKRADDAVLTYFHSLSDEWLEAFAEAGVVATEVSDPELAKLVLAAAASVVSEIAMDRRGGGDNTEGRQRQRRTMSLPSLTLEKRADVIAAVQSVVDPGRM